MELSSYQKNVFDWISSGTGNGIGEACAGAGKTFVIERAVRMIPLTASCNIFPFNSHIVEELVKRCLPGRTLNSFGYEIVRRNIPRLNFVKSFKTYNWLKDRCGNDFEFYGKIRRAVNQLCSLGKALIITNIDDFDYETIASDYGCDLPVFKDPKDTNRFDELTMECYEYHLMDSRNIDFDDQIFKVLQLGMVVPKIDFVMVDETQDYSPMGIELSKRSIGERAFYVGDSYQSIYRFRGASFETMSSIKDELNCTSLPLSICYRCAKSVVEHAAQCVPKGHILAWDKSPQGTVGYINTEKFVKMVQTGDMVTCRITAPLIKRCLQQLKMKKPAYVKGRQIADALIDLVETVGDPFQPIVYFLGKLKEYVDQETTRLEELGREEAADSLNDRYESLIFFSGGMSTVKQLIDRIKEVVKDSSSGIIFTTIHRSKGLESDRVFCIRADKCPHKRGDPDEEERLMYVQRTRAKRELFYVAKEKDER